MPGLGLSIDLSSVTSGASAAAAIEDYVWDVVGGELTPRDGIAYDFSDSWDVTSTELTPAVSPGEEGYWNVDGNGDLTPK
mgnify:FL=1|tara:strand:+ start:3431 stop:3670 length:240 start_codon:yes stop_codon:yes gene_type:complete